MALLLIVRRVSLWVSSSSSSSLLCCGRVSRCGRLLVLRRLGVFLCWLELLRVLILGLLLLLWVLVLGLLLLLCLSLLPQKLLLLTPDLPFPVTIRVVRLQRVLDDAVRKETTGALATGLLHARHLPRKERKEINN